MFLFITADRIGVETGGGLVTKNELDALVEMGQVTVINPPPTADPFATENVIPDFDLSKIKLAHFYSGTFPKLAKKLKDAGIKITYTAAAHDVKLSKEEHEKNGFQYNLPHITNPELFEKYLFSYRVADRVICPSYHSKSVMEGFGCNKITVVPHGCELMRPSKRYPKTFTVGYLGQIGPDKGLIYLLQAWNKLGYKDAVLQIAGRQSMGLLPLTRQMKKGHINLMGYVKSIENFYNSCNIYVQPSVTEGFGIEILEAINCHRPVVVSDGAGGADCVNGCGLVVPKRNIDELAGAIDKLKTDQETFAFMANNCAENSRRYTWDKIRAEYQKVWKEVLA
jgi:glycosyltransferase involved in cell wall biosynthesis